MAVSLKHTTQATGTDAGNGEIGKSQWNEEHTLTLSSGNLLGRSTAGAGAAEEISVGTGLTLSAGSLGVTSGTYASAGAATSSGLTMATAKMLGRSSASTGAIEEIAIGTGLSLSGGTLSSTVTVSPAGSTTQVQFNDAGAFGADSGLTFNKTSKALTVGGATVTTSSPVLDLAQTWNAGAVAFTGLKFNATDTASAAASLLMDLQVGGSSKVSVRKDGRIVATAGTDGNNPNGFAFGTGNEMFASSGANNLLLRANGVNAVSINAGQVKFGLGVTFGFGTDANAYYGTVDTLFGRRAAANLRLGAADAAAPVAQTLSVQSVVAGTTNTAGANLTITGSQGTGTGAGGSIIFQVAPAGSSGTAQNALATAWSISGAGNLLSGSDGLYNIGAAATNRPANIYLTGDLVAGGNVQVAAGQLFRFLNRGSIWATADGVFQFSNSAASSTFVLAAEAANTLAQRNGTNAQTKRLYRSYTDASNYSRLTMGWNTSTALVMAEGAGTGSDGSVAFNDAALATNATVGFVMIPSCAGAPSGTPADIPTGQIPMVWDSTNLKLYVYTGGAWKASAAFT